MHRIVDRLGHPSPRVGLVTMLIEHFDTSKLTTPKRIDDILRVCETVGNPNPPLDMLVWEHLAGPWLVLAEDSIALCRNRPSAFG